MQPGQSHQLQLHQLILAPVMTVYAGKHCAICKQGIKKGHNIHKTEAYNFMTWSQNLLTLLLCTPK